MTVKQNLFKALFKFLYFDFVEFRQSVYRFFHKSAERDGPSAQAFNLATRDCYGFEENLTYSFQIKIIYLRLRKNKLKT